LRFVSWDFLSPDSGRVLLLIFVFCLRRRRIRPFRGPYVSTTKGFHPFDPLRRRCRVGRFGMLIEVGDGMGRLFIGSFFIGYVSFAGGFFWFRSISLVLIFAYMREAPLAWISGEGGRSRRVGRGDGAAIEHRFLPSLSSESRPEGHPHLWSKLTPTAVSQKKIKSPKKCQKSAPLSETGKTQSCC